MLAPAMVKALAPPGTRVGWFLHVPMSSIGFSSLPVATELLRGLLAADVVGFHTPASVIEFAACVARNLPDARVRPTCVVTGGASPHSCAALAAPIGIAPEAFERTASSAACQARVAELKARFAGQRLVVSVDRLDVIKGVPHRLLGIEAFLAEHSEARGAVAFVQVSVPSREDVPAVRELVRTTHELVGHVNARFGPHVHLLYGSVGAVELCALYAAADALLVTSLADGFNLVALEYVAAQAATPDDCKGALILSEFCGCAQSLCGAVRVNPYGASDISRGLAEALALPAAERLARWQAQAAYVRRHTAAAWAHGFLATLRGSGSGGDAEAGGA